MPQARCKMQDETCNTQHATCRNMQHAACNARHAACNTRHAACNDGLRGGRGVHEAQAARSARHATRSDKLREDCTVQRQRQRPPCRMQRAACEPRHATHTNAATATRGCSLQDCNMQHAPMQPCNQPGTAQHGREPRLRRCNVHRREDRRAGGEGAARVRERVRAQRACPRDARATQRWHHASAHGPSACAACIAAVGGGGG